MNDFREYSDYLIHYGVKGMKWKHHIYAKVKEPVKKGNGQSSNNTDDSDSGSGKFDWEKAYSDIMSRAENADTVGTDIEQMINDGKYVDALKYYDSLDDQTKNDVGNYVVNTMLAGYLGNGNVRSGRKKIDSAKETVNAFLDNFSPKAQTTREIRINEDFDKDRLQGHRKRR